MEKNQSVNTVTLDFYSGKYESILSDYDLAEEQIRFTSLPSQAILACEIDKTRYPIVILSNGKPAGFFVLHGWEGVKAYSDNRDAILLRAYSINSKFQGKGIAKRSLSILDSFIKSHFPTSNEIILAVNHQNTVAQHLYKVSGFVDKGIRVMGRIGEQYILHKVV
ncbi:GNAT family N-acetyltransferase [Robertmurraya yapensis]|uniref:GNAT family N-acetyltransferase n=2 Tax=Bacillaceae TaxID=186817 RepID=A0A3S0J166_9BACI|nr:GNAT family N-acetyltransferase [Bacillus yapensis]RTR35782.1 GNAT family N-acetyltransferase [Bacillus yapensis]TKS98584.1 GNAT family N-acetyltransferase [Bacillus yapensis]